MRLRFGALAAAALLLPPALAACGTDDPSSATDKEAVAGSTTAAAVVAKVAKDDALNAQLPADVRSAGTITTGISTVGAPFTFLAPDNKTQIGIEIDLRDAVAKVLGVRAAPTTTKWDSLLVGVQTGKFRVAQGNFGVTKDRLKTYDFVTYYNDGFGFLANPATNQPAVTQLTDLCGRKVGTFTGTSFIGVLQSHEGDCAKLGRQPWKISTYPDQASFTLALDQKRIDLYLRSAIRAQYDAKQQPAKLAFKGTLNSEHVGFVLKKGDALGPVLQKAVQKLIDDGTYARILQAWGLQTGAVSTSQLNPPGLD
ncbi:transporter substrate-binding domain-containing protein [Actinomadura rayongensis]|uniref:Transporter substrate-binding domain-containing protein n=1 Tax=Actinomadura rayongensis TaxID=1429076 RepID=A0A6I4WE75_9ACTN|nr:transporter substrate-binding domain-containing protein [Actinomadura rayongensis]MXQ68021.1 transporter substrate-binding domain-containing protein [Actinomadura rayongensis]